METLLEQAGWN